MKLNGGMIVHGALYRIVLDELSCAGENYHRGFGNLSDHSGVLDLATAGLSKCDAEELKGGSVDENGDAFDFANNKGATKSRVYAIVFI